LKGIGLDGMETHMKFKEFLFAGYASFLFIPSLNSNSWRWMSLNGDGREEIQCF